MTLGCNSISSSSFQASIRLKAQRHKVIVTGRRRKIQSNLNGSLSFVHMWHVFALLVSSLTLNSTVIHMCVNASVFTSRKPMRNNFSYGQRVQFSTHLSLFCLLKPQMISLWVSCQVNKWNVWTPEKTSTYVSVSLLFREVFQIGGGFNLNSIFHA